MREILFRGKRKDNSEWICGSLVIRGNQYFIFTGEIKNFGGMINWIWYETNPEIVCQYTGLTDRNGRKIFEGDIVKINNDVKEAFEISDGAVIYRGGSFIVGNSSGNGTLNSLFAITDINYVLRGEVIGNIFDNPELIGE